jgi:hypothetical protein
MYILNIYLEKTFSFYYFRITIKSIYITFMLIIFYLFLKKL